MRDDLDAATLRDLADVSRGESTVASAAYLYEYALMLIQAYVSGDVYDDDFLGAVKDWMQAVALLPENKRND